MSIKSHKKSSTQGSIGEPLIRVEHLTTYFELTQGFIDSLLRKKAPIVHAVEDISLDIRQNEILALGGESGCGKTTLGRTIIQLTPSTKGCVYFDGEDLEKLLYESGATHITEVGWWTCKSEEQLFKGLEEYLEINYEGVIIRLLDGEYTLGHRSRSLLKLKKFED